MTDQTDENGKLLPDKDRMTRLGKWLRATSLDELLRLFYALDSHGFIPVIPLPYYMQVTTHRY